MTRKQIVAGRSENMKYGIGIRHRIHWFLPVSLILAALFLWSGKGYAQSEYLPLFTGKYPAATALNTCLVCHQANASGGRANARNGYGSAWSSAGGNTAAFGTIEGADSDGDGFTNIAEINANTFPGNSASFPAGTNTAPVAVNDSYSVTASTTLAVDAGTGVLANDTDAQGDPLTAVLVAAPSSGTLNLSSNGSFTYTPTIASGSVNFTYLANDGSLDSTTAATVTITVNGATVSGPLTVSPAGGLASSGTIGGPFSPSSQTYTLTNTGTASMNWTASKVASWVTLSATAGTLASGATTTVTASINSGANSLAAGSYTDNITFTNTSNGSGNTTRPVSLTVNATEAPTISTVSLPAGAVDTAYSQTLAATGGTTPYSWSVSVGTLPAGLTLSTVGVLSGTPTTAESSGFTVRVEGADGASSTKVFSVTINAAAPPPTVNLSSDSGGGGCSVAARTGSGGSYIDGTLILAGLGIAVWGIRMRRRRS